MTACSSQLTWISMVTESTWAENSTSTASQIVIPHNGRADVSKLTQAMIDSARAKQYRNEVPTGIVGSMAGAEFTFQMYMVGHGSTTSGATTATEFENAMAWIVGAGGRCGLSSAVPLQAVRIVVATSRSRAGLRRGGRKGMGMIRILLQGCAVRVEDSAGGWAEVAAQAVAANQLL